MTPAFSAVPIVGREPELAAIEAALDGLGQGTPVWLALEGEPGIGKTRLLAECRARAEDRGHLVLSGSAAEFERDVPFSVWIDALDAYVASQDLGRHDAWNAGLARELGAVLPRLRPAAGGRGEEPLADERYRIFRAVTTLLGVLSEDQALVLVLDDLHWSDGASLELIASLLRRGTSADVLVALAFRPAQAPSRLLHALATAQAPAQPLTHLRLGPLGEQAATQLLGGLEGSAAAAIVRHSGGNPFYLEQLARAVEGGALPAQLHEPGAGELPDAVAASLGDELAAVPPTARALLDAAAVAGEPFEPDLAATIAGLEIADAFTALDSLLAVDLVRPTNVPRRFAFRHPLVRRAVYEATPGGWRLAAHARAAAALEASGASAAERAHHVEQAASQGDDAAIALLLEAGADAAARAPAVAVRWFSSALRLLPSADRDRHVDVRVALAGAQRSLGELERCRATLLEAGELLAPGATSRRVELTALCASVEHWLGRHEEAHRRLTWAWEDLPDRSSAAAAALQVELAVDGLYGMDLEQTLANGRGAVETARRLDDRVLRAAAAAVLALGEALAGEIGAARERRDEAVGLLERFSDAQLAARLDVLYYLAWADTYLERYDDAIAHADRGIAAARATGAGRLLVPLMLAKGYPYQMQGRLAEAIEVAETAVEIARLSANPHYLFWALFEVGWARYFAGHLDAAVVACEESARMGSLTGGAMPSVGGGPGSALAVCRLESGDAEGGRALMLEVFGEHPERWAPTETCFNWESLTLAELALGDVDAADRHASRAQADAAALDLHLPRALAERCRSAVQLARGDGPGAADAAAA
ncbi:MAG TPA: AAA family ATPase, partial [Solirubrobacteraceae bacterium]|nr:AAA family ATPase [Solirubrobacteraceae bacterium]